MGRPKYVVFFGLNDGVHVFERLERQKKCAGAELPLAVSMDQTKLWRSTVTQKLKSLTTVNMSGNVIRYTWRKLRKLLLFKNNKTDWIWLTSISKILKIMIKNCDCSALTRHAPKKARQNYFHRFTRQCCACVTEHCSSHNPPCMILAPPPSPAVSDGKRIITHVLILVCAGTVRTSSAFKECLGART